MHPVPQVSFSSVSAAGPRTAADSLQQVSSRVAGSTWTLSSTRVPPPSSSRPTSIPKAVPSRRTLAKSESDDSDLASVASHLSDSDDELDTMERNIHPKRVLTEANGTTRSVSELVLPRSCLSVLVPDSLPNAVGRFSVSKLQRRRL